MKLLTQMFTSLRNAQASKHLTTTLQYSRFCWNILLVLYKHGYIQGLQKNKKNILVVLKYVNDRPALQKITQVSTSSQRVYKRIDEFRDCSQGLGLTLISTSKGILSSSKALELKVGGEILCEVF